MVDLVKKQEDERINVNQLCFIRNKQNWTMHTEEKLKKYQQVYDKRILLEDLSTLPFGFKLSNQIL
jgi:HSP90 family molecular chaperone